MMTNLFLNILICSVSVSPVILLLAALAPLLHKRYALKWSYLIWLLLALRLILPFQFSLPLPQLAVTVPTQITAPLEAADKNDAALVQPLETGTIPAAQGNNLTVLPQAQPETTALSALDVIAGLWLIGCLLFLFVHIVSLLHYKHQILKKGIAVEDLAVWRQCDRLSEELQLRSGIRIISYQDAGSPMVIGFWKPILVLPTCSYSEEELFFILKHELIHIKRRDIWFKLLFVLANAVHWFNPFAYILQKEAVIAMELSCDERVVQQTETDVRKAYTEALFSSFTRRSGRKAVLTTQFYGSKRIMKKRFQNILTDAPKKNGTFVCICTLCAALLFGTLIACSTANDSVAEAPAQTNTGISDAALQDTDTPQEESEPVNSPGDTAASEQNISFETIAYLKSVGNGSVGFDRAEWVEVPSDRATELGITADDAPSGFSVYNPEDLTETCPLSSDCAITVLDWTNNYSVAEVTADDFIQLLNDRGEQNTGIPYTVTVENGEIIQIVEHYVP